MRQNKTVLIIDDDQSHLITAKGIIEALGYRVEVHNSPFRSTAKLLQLRPDLVLIDVNMPALPGDRLCAMLRSEPELARLPIYLYSSNDENVLRKSAIRYQASGYICKGNIGRLRQTVRQVLEESIRP